VTPHVVGKVMNGVGRCHRLTGGRRSKRTTHTRARARLPRGPAAATYSGRSQVSRSSDSASSAFATRMATSSVSPTCVRSAGTARTTGAWPPAQKLEFLLGMSLDDIYEIMSWPIGELDPFRLSVRMQVTRVVFMIGVKALLDGSFPFSRFSSMNRGSLDHLIKSALEPLPSVRMEFDSFLIRSCRSLFGFFSIRRA